MCFSANLAQEARNLASDEQSPLAKKQLEDFARNMQNKSDAIIDHANLLLADPTNEKTKQQLLNDFAGAQKDIENFNDPLKQKNFQSGAMDPNNKNNLKTAESLKDSLKVFNY